MTDYTKLTAEEARELSMKEHDVCFISNTGTMWTPMEIIGNHMSKQYTFTAYKLVPYGEVSISPEAAEKLKNSLYIEIGCKVMNILWAKAVNVIDNLTKGADE